MIQRVSNFALDIEQNHGDAVPVSTFDLFITS